ncbi:MAG TPA: glycine zipper domain-containing protein [Chitinophagaceae bacterium]|nr:glycine zipper domain-containing protein [Chitinophagaceae bacterium]
MKKIMFLLLATPVLMTACKNNQSSGPGSVESITAAAIRLGNEQQDVAQQMNERYAAQQQQRVVYVNSSTNEAKVTKKRGMSKAAKGAIIGGTAGAVTVGVITKSGKGAVIGGVLGAGAGYIIGRKKDKRDGRVQ